MSEYNDGHDEGFADGITVGLADAASKLRAAAENAHVDTAQLLLKLAREIEVGE